MPSFDTVSDLDEHEVRNAVDQANREISTRFDFKGSNAKLELQDKEIKMTCQSEFQLQQMMPILHTKLVKRGIDIKCLESGKVETALNQARQTVTLRQGIDTVLAKKIVKLFKESKLKVQASIQGEKVRITGKKRDDLQQAIALLKETDFDVPLQYENFRD